MPGTLHSLPSPLVVDPAQQQREGGFNSLTCVMPHAMGCQTTGVVVHERRGAARLSPGGVGISESVALFVAAHPMLSSMTLWDVLPQVTYAQ